VGSDDAEAMDAPVVVVGIGGAGGVGVLEDVLPLAAAAASTLLCVHVEGQTAVPEPGTAALLLARTEATGLCHLDCELVMAGAGVDWTFEVRRGTPAVELAAAAEDADAACIVVGHKPGRRLGRRSLPRRLLRRTRRPVLVVPVAPAPLIPDSAPERRGPE
jgi:nucleotide-binding universal stress UspA family protein